MRSAGSGRLWIASARQLQVVLALLLPPLLVLLVLVAIFADLSSARARLLQGQGAASALLL